MTHPSRTSIRPRVITGAHLVVAAGLITVGLTPQPAEAAHFHSWDAPAASQQVERTGAFREDFTANVGVFQRYVSSRFNGMTCGAGNVKRVAGKLRIWATPQASCGRVSTEGHAAFGGRVLDLRARVKSNAVDGDGGWVTMDTFRTGRPSDGETSFELVKGRRANMRNHTGPGVRCSGPTAGQVRAVSLRRWTTIRTVIEPGKVSWFVGGELVQRETRKQHEAAGCQWVGDVIDSAGRVLPRYVVFAVLVGGADTFGGPITRPRKVNLAVDWVRVAS